MSKRRAKGEGSIYKRDDGLWVGQLYLPSGKKKVKYGKTQREIRDWLQEQCFCQMKTGPFSQRI